MICKWCGNSYPQLGKSHLIPQAFFNFDKETDRKIVSETSPAKRAPTGPWDNKILCQSCEKNFSDIDSVAAGILLNDIESQKIPFNNICDTIGFQIDGRYFQPLKQFLIYTLWKCSVSQLAEFRNVKLGPYEDIIKLQLINKTIFTPDEYSFAAFRIKNPAGHIFPYREARESNGGVNYYSIELGPYIFEVKIDKRSVPKTYEVITRHTNVLFIELATTPKNRHEAMVDIVKKHAANLKALREPRGNS